MLEASGRSGELDEGQAQNLSADLESQKDQSRDDIRRDWGIVAASNTHSFPVSPEQIPAASGIPFLLTVTVFRDSSRSQLRNGSDWSKPNTSSHISLDNG